MARNITGRYVKNLSSWRRMAAVAWSPPDDPTIYGTIDLDMTDVWCAEAADCMSVGVARHIRQCAEMSTLGTPS